MDRVGRPRGEARPDLAAVKDPVFLVPIVVRDLEVAVFEEALSDQEIVGLVSREPNFAL